MTIQGPPLTPPRWLKFWSARPGGPYTLRLLSPADFAAAARRYGHDPDTKAAFAIWGRWYARDEIICRVDRLDLIAHEIRHIQDGHFHD